jgi:hypothetical protein
VIVSPEKIQAMHYKRLTQGYEINTHTNYSLLKIKSFHIQPELLSEYESYCGVLFSSFKRQAVNQNLK